MDESRFRELSPQQYIRELFGETNDGKLNNWKAVMRSGLSPVSAHVLTRGTGSFVSRQRKIEPGMLLRRKHILWQSNLLMASM